MARRRKPYWHPTERWCFTVTGPDGKRRTVYDKAGIRKTEKAAAREWMDRTLEALEERRVTGSDYTVNDIRLAYLTWAEKQVEAGKAARHTFDGHRKQLRLVCRAAVGGRPFGSRLARDLTARDVDGLKAAWEGKSDTTVRNRLASLMAALNWASSVRHDRPVDRLIPANPLEGVELPKAVAAEGRYSPSGEVAAFLSFVDRWAEDQKGHGSRFARMTALLVRVVATTGCRPGELCAARWAHLAEGARTIVLPPADHKTGRKTRKSRFIVMPPDVAERVQSLRSDPDRHPEFIFTHRSHSLTEKRTDGERRAGEPWNSSALSRRVKELRRAAIAAGVLKDDQGVARVHLYKLRHTFATNAIQSGESIANVAGFLGNSARMVENVYLHQQVAHLEGVSDRVTGGGKGQ